MTDNTELQRLVRLHRLARQIEATLPAEQAVRAHGYVRELPAGAPRHVSKPTPSKASLRARLEEALANYHGPVTLCPPAPPPKREELELDEDEERDYQAPDALP